MTRLKDIAARAGCSIMTVSKVLRHRGDISAPTRERVMKIAREMGYVPNSAARGLRTKHSQLFGLVISSVTDPIHARIVLALEALAFKDGYQVILSHSMNNTEREQTVLRQLISRRVDGIFIIPNSQLPSDTQTYEEIRKRKIPLVFLGPKPSNCPDFPSVACNEEEASSLITQHLIKLGHRRIAFLAGANHSPSSHDRLEGYKKAYRENRIPLDDQLLFHAGSTIEDGARAALQMLQERPQATAVQTVNDLVAIGAANTFLNQGLRIPDDISIAGFGNILTSEHFKVPLTTIRQPKYRIGEAAMEVMKKLLNNEPVHPRILSGEILVRNSTGPIPTQQKGI